MFKQINILFTLGAQQ